SLSRAVRKALRKALRKADTPSLIKSLNGKKSSVHHPKTVFSEKCSIMRAYFCNYVKSVKKPPLLTALL
ncbi:MAG: hypothetical protein ACOCM4_13355, partial [Acetivibrio ethanolgignens]